MLQAEKGPVGSVQANHTLVCRCLAIVSLRFARGQGEEQEKCQQGWCRSVDGTDEVGLHTGTWKEQSGKACSSGASTWQALDTTTPHPRKRKNYLSCCCTDKGARMTQANKSTVIVMPAGSFCDGDVALQGGLAATILASLASDVVFSGIFSLSPRYWTLLSSETSLHLLHWLLPALIYVCLCSWAKLSKFICKH